MPMAKETRVFAVSREKLYRAIVDYKAYPQFLEGIDNVDILEQTSSTAVVRFCLNLIKEFSYVLVMQHDEPKSVSWVLQSGDIFQKNEGSWLLEQTGEDETKGTYTLDVDLKIFMPKMISKKLVSSNLPRTMESFYERAKGI